MSGAQDEKKRLTIILVATDWANAPRRVPVATFVMQIPFGSLPKLAQTLTDAKIKVGDTVTAVWEACRENLHVTAPEDFMMILGGYIGHTQAFATAVAGEGDTIWVKLLGNSLTSKCALRPIAISNFESLEPVLTQVRRDPGAMLKDEQVLWVYDDRHHDVTGSIRRSIKLVNPSEPSAIHTLTPVGDQVENMTPEPYGSATAVSGAGFATQGYGTGKSRVNEISSKMRGVR